MVDISDFPRINSLITESNNIIRAIDNIDDGGIITSMVIAPRPDQDGTAIPASVVTTYMRAPSAMYQAIRELLLRRQEDISDELSDLGVRGVENR